MNPEEPTLAAAVAYFTDMAKGKTTASRKYSQNGLGAAKYPSTYRVIPNIKFVTPSAQALAQAKDSLDREEVIRGKPKPRKRHMQAPSGQRKKSKGYLTPGLN